ncbi:unnamed protein product [Scytosiphon promiscuus]
MHPQRGGGGIARPGRGVDVDLEALQDAFLSSAEKPSARVTRSKPPTIKPGSSLGTGKGNQDARKNSRSSTDPTAKNTPSSGTRDEAVAGRGAGMNRMPPAESTPGGTKPTGATAPAEARRASPLSSSPSPAGGMVLNAPGVVSKTIMEREVKPPAPMRIGGFGGGGGSVFGRGAIGIGGGGDKQRAGLTGGARSSSSDAIGGSGVGGFPEVRHRSQMGLVKLGGRAATASAAAATTAAGGEDPPKIVAGSKRAGGRGGGSDGGGRKGRGIPGDIHEENLSRVSAMSPDEIAEAQQEIRAALPQGALEMLMRRGRGAGGRSQGAAAAAAAVTAGGEDKHKGDSNGVDSPKTAPTATATATATTAPDDAETTIAGAAAGGAGAAQSTTRGAPTGAQRAATAAGGIGSEEALEAALLTLPPEERAKSSWTLGEDDGDAETGEAYGAGGGQGRGRRGTEARVDLDGVVVPTVPAAVGGGGGEEGRGRGALHHHGDDPGEAGYTPSELVRLARSTVSGQRQLALRALAGVLRIRAACIARGQAPPHPRLPETLPVVLRMCLDDGNPSVASAALSALEAFLAPLARDIEEEENAMQGLSWVDYQALPSEARPLCTPEEKNGLPALRDDGADEGDEGGDGRDGEETGGKTVGELARLCYEDPCRGMLEMALLPKITSMITTNHAGKVAASTAAGGTHPPASDDAGRSSDLVAGASTAVGRHRGRGADPVIRPRAALSCLRVLCAVAGRAPWAAERVAREPGLLDAVREAFLEPSSDGTLPFELSGARSAATSASEQHQPPPPRPSSPPQSPTTTSRAPSSAVRGGAHGRRGDGESSAPFEERSAALLAVRLARMLVQSERGVALLVSRTPLLESARGFLALGQGSNQPLPMLEAVQREVLELWRCCLSYGIDVAAADTVVLVARGQGWWPGLDSVVARPVLVADGESAVAAAAVEPAPGDVGVSVGGRDGSLSPKLAFVRALHQLACACVLPPSRSSGGSAGSIAGSDGTKPAEGRSDRARGGPGKGPPAAAATTLSLGGLAVVPESTADMGDTVDAAVEATLSWLLSAGRSGGGEGGAGTGGTAERSQQAAAIHLVACWVERYQSMSRDSARRTSHHLESTAEDAAVLFSTLLASRSRLVPAAVAAAAHGATDQPLGGSGDSLPAVAAAAAAAAAASAAAGLDWLSAVFRLGLACEKATPGEAEAALASAPEATCAALAGFLGSAAASGTAGISATAGAAAAPRGFGRRLRRAEAGARWLGCRLMACGSGGVGGGRWRWPALRRDCALQAIALCEQGDEAVAVGLLAEALPDSPVNDAAKEGGGRNGEDCALATSLLRKLFRGAISDTVALTQASFHLDGRWASLQSLRACAPPGAASLLPLPKHWLFLPLASQGGEKAASTAVSACLSYLVRLEREGSAYVCGVDGGGGRHVSPEVKLYHLANACLYGASVLSAPGADEDFDWLCTRYLEQCGRGFEGRLADVISRLALASAPDPAKLIADAAAAAGRGTGSTGKAAAPPATAQDRVRAARAQQSHAERALLEFVKDLVGSFLADSFGIPSFARILRVFVRTGFPASARRVVWKELGDVGLLHLLDPPGPTTTTAADAAAASSPAATASASGATLADGSGYRHPGDEAYLYPPDTEGGIVEAYLDALEHPRFGPQTGEGRQLPHCQAKYPTEWREDKSAAAAAAAAAGAAKASAGGKSRGEHEEAPSATALVPMWEVAVHHVACYLFSPPPPCNGTGPAPAPGAGLPPAPRDSGEGQASGNSQDELPWRPDFGRRKTFERLLRQHAGNPGGKRGEAGSGVASSVAAAVLGHCRPGSTGPPVSGDEVAEEGRGGCGARGPAWTSRLSRSRRELLRAYCRARGGAGGRGHPAVGADGKGADCIGVGGGVDEGAVDVLAWLDDGRSVEDAVERLARAINF